jgi:inhibitor of KinA sporulation pathway (predicted exonuclease)
MVVLDLEATCWAPGQGHGVKEAEVIEIGAVKLAEGSLSVVNRLETFVSPVRHPGLSAYCQELTGIVPAMLHGAPRFPEAYHQLVRFCGRRNHTLLAAWGQFDRTLLLRECERWGLSDQLPHEYLNLARLFQTLTGCPKKLSLHDAMGWLGLVPEGPAHRALPDAWNAARVWRALLQRPEEAHELAG